VDNNETVVYEISVELKEIYRVIKKEVYIFKKLFYKKTTDARSMSCVWMERKSLKVLI
jgi:hypothetical protein